MPQCPLVYLLIASLVAGITLAQDYYYQSPPANYGRFGYGASTTAQFWLYYNITNNQPTHLGFAYTIESLYAMPNRSTPPYVDTVNFYPIPENMTGGNMPQIPYVQLGAYWLPNGHPPDNMLVPHFDIHYYYLTSAQLDAIQGAAPSEPGACCVEPGLCLAQQSYCNAIMPLPEGCCPNGYSPMGLVIPNMGSHTMNMSEPDMHGGPFIQDMVFGMWNGSLAFNEAMVNLQLMINVSLDQPTGGGGGGSAVSNPYCIDFSAAMPKYVPKPGWYATKVCTGYNNETEIGYSELTNFIEYTNSQICPSSLPRTTCATPLYDYPKGCSCNFNPNIASGIHHHPKVIVLTLLLLFIIFSILL
jgi:hypothetical protein